MGNVYGGGNLGDVGTYEPDADGYNIFPTNTGICTVTIYDGTIGAAGKSTAEHASGHVFGAGKGQSDSFECDKAMVYKASVTIKNGTVYGNVYGGGQIGRVENNTDVTIGEGDGVEESTGTETTSTPTSAPEIKGSVFGAGAGVETHGYSALVRYDSRVTVQGNATVGHSVYGGGEIATVGRYNIATTPEVAAAHFVEVGMPYETLRGGNCTVDVKGYAQIGTEGRGCVFGAGMGIDESEKTYSYTNISTMPKRMMSYSSTLYDDDDKGITWDYIREYSDDELDDDDVKKYVWEYYPDRNGYLVFLQTLALATETDVTVGANAKVNGSVYGGSESGFVQHHTGVKIQGDCQILTTGTDENGKPKDGNVFGGGKGVSGFEKAGIVKGNAKLAISGGTIGNNVYGGGELGFVGTFTPNGRNYNWQKIKDTDAKETGVCIVTITDATVNGNVFGAGKGEATTFKCESAMVRTSNVTISNGTIGGNVYGGGEVGRVDQNAVVKIGFEHKADGSTKYYEQTTGETVTYTEATVETGSSVVGKYDRSGEEGSYVYTLIEENEQPTINGSVYGAGAGVETHGYSALVRGNTILTVQGKAKVGKSVFGGGQIAAVGKYALDDDNMPTTLVGGGECKVVVQGDAEIGPDNGGGVFGAGEGVEPLAKYINVDTYTTDIPKRMTTRDPESEEDMDLYPDDDEGKTWDWYDKDNKLIWNYLNTKTEYLKFLQTLALVTDTKLTIDGKAKVYGSVYGGSRSGFVQRYTDVKIQGDCQILTTTGTGGKAEDGNVFGGGKGLVTFAEAGRTRGTVTVTVSGGTTKGSVYGGSALADTNTDNWDVTNNNWASGKSSASNTTTVNLLGGTIEGDAYGGGLGESATASSDGDPAYVWGDVLVELNKPATVVNGGCAVNRIFGCNNLNGSPKGEVTVHVYGTRHAEKTSISEKVARDKDVDDALADDSTPLADLKQILADKISIASLLGITITNYKNVYDDDQATAVEVKEAITGISTAITEKETTATDKQKEDVNALRYDVEAVYGGGNLASYIPVLPTTNVAHVIIEGCDETCIETVYGGGNAASAPGTHVEVISCYEINTVFGGGNGKDNLPDGSANPGAHVGYLAYDENAEDIDEAKTEATYGTGEALAELKGGTIHHAFGGSNTKGNVRTSALVDLNEPENNPCPLQIDEVYGAGNEADQDGSSNINLGCISYLSEIYGGSKNADVNSDVELTIQSGTFDRVFGGNNLGGCIRGYIKVNIEETGCHPVIIGQLYGGGNQAGYSIYGYDNNKKPLKTGSNPWDDPEVNVRSFTSIGEIYGGGFGADAVMVGNPTVNINVGEGKFSTKVVTSDTDPEYGAYDATGYKGITKSIGGQNVIIPPHVVVAGGSNIGVIQNVYGGGNAAEVEGNTNVNIGTMAYVPMSTVVAGETNVNGLYARSGNGTTASPYEYTKIEVLAENGVTYCALNVGDDETNPPLTVEVGVTDVSNYYMRTGEGTDDSPFVYTSQIPLAANNTTYCMLVLGVDIQGNVYGGGNAADVTGDTNVTIGKEPTE